MTLARWCRRGAILIAMLGVVDPSMTLARSARPTVSVIDASPTTSVADRIRRTLADDAAVVPGLTADAAAVVVIGDRLPPFAADVSVPAFVVRPDGPRVDIERLAGPARSPLDARASFVASVHATGAAGQKLSLTLAANGVVLDREDRAIAGDDARMDVPLTFVPSEMGPARLRVTASLNGASSTSAAAADVLTRVDRSTWTVFAYDARPSWMSTFVRRALEDDNRFAVTTRTMTSRSVAISTPGAPPDLANPSSLDRFDAIVVGAPDALTAGEVANLEAYLTRRGGAVILLWDVRPTGQATTLTGVDRWQFDTQAADRAVTTPSGTMRASDLAWPARLPAGAETIGRADATPAAGADGRQTVPIVWRADRGPGRVVVSGALDSWRYRDAPQSAFDAVWQRLVAEAAEASPPPVSLEVTPAVARPGQRIAIHARIRDAELAAGTPSSGASSQASIESEVALTLTDSAGERTTLRAWPDGAPGRFVATTSAPGAAGAYVVTAASRASGATADLVVDPAASTVSQGEEDALGAWATSRGGRVVAESALTGIGTAIRHLAPPAASPGRVHPMRSPWWIAPVTLLAGIEWWTRRRRGLK